MAVVRTTSLCGELGRISHLLSDKGIHMVPGERRADPDKGIYRDSCDKRLCLRDSVYPYHMTSLCHIFLGRISHVLSDKGIHTVPGERRAAPLGGAPNQSYCAKHAAALADCVPLCV
jgi:hypothetical protein